MKSLYKFVLKDRGEKEVLGTVQVTKGAFSFRLFVCAVSHHAFASKIVHEMRRLFYSLTGETLPVSIDIEKIINTDDGASAGIFRHQAKALGRVAHHLL